MSNQYDILIQDITAKFFPVCDWRLIKAQIQQESSFNPTAQSPCGARGLLQLMPATAKEVGYQPEELWDPQKNLCAGIKYLYEQYRHFPEIPDHNYRLKFALAAYNGGRGYINAALKLAYEREHGEVNQSVSARKPGLWQTWEHTKNILRDQNCFVIINNKQLWPDHNQIIGYVDKIYYTYMGYKENG